MKPDPCRKSYFMEIGWTMLPSDGHRMSSVRPHACTAIFRQFYLRRQRLAIGCSLRLTRTWSLSLFAAFVRLFACVERQRSKIRAMSAIVSYIILQMTNLHAPKYESQCNPHPELIIVWYAPGVFVMCKEGSQRLPISSRTPITANQISNSYSPWHPRFALHPGISISALRKSNCSANVHHFILYRQLVDYAQPRTCNWPGKRCVDIAARKHIREGLRTRDTHGRQIVAPAYYWLIIPRRRLYRSQHQSINSRFHCNDWCHSRAQFATTTSDR